MNAEELATLAREAGLPQKIKGRPDMVSLWDVELRRFAALVAARCYAEKPQGYALVLHPEDPVLPYLPDGQWVILQRKLPPSI